MKERLRKYTVEEVIDLETGKIFPAGHVLSVQSSEHHKQRLLDETAKIHGKAVRYHCPLCIEPLTIRGYRDQSFYFRHPDNPGAQCPYRSEHSLTEAQINAMKYDGAKESFPHRRIKNLLYESLLSDRKIDSASIFLEKRIQSTSPDWTQWRKPDVQAKREGRLWVFEIQLSTTFLSVIAGRRDFYLKNDAILIWIFNEDSIDDDNMRFTERDVYYNNNRNLFFVSSNTVENSKAQRECRIWCKWEEPFILNERIEYRWNEKEISLSELKIDYAKQRSYYFDFDTEEEKLKRELEHLAVRREEERKARSIYIDSNDDSDGWGEEDEEEDYLQHLSPWEKVLAQQKQEDAEYRENLISSYNIPPAEINTSENFCKFWIRAALEENSKIALKAIWSHYFSQLNHIWSDAPEELSINIENLLNALFSLKKGTVIGSKLKNLRALENHIYVHYRQFYRFFAFGVRHFKREEELAILKPGSTCYKHVQEYKQNFKKPAFAQDRKPQPLVEFLFPHLIDL